LLKLGADAGLRERLGRAARRHAVVRLDREAILDQFERSLLSVLGVSSVAGKERHLAARRENFAVEKSAAAGNAGED